MPFHSTIYSELKRTIQQRVSKLVRVFHVVSYISGFFAPRKSDKIGCLVCSFG